MSDKGNASIGVAWWRREQWNRLRDISEDGDKLDDSYDDWLANAEMAVEAAFGAEKVDVDVEQLLAWCNEKGLPVNGASRAQYVSQVLRDRDQTV